MYILVMFMINYQIIKCFHYYKNFGDFSSFLKTIKSLIPTFIVPKYLNEKLHK